MDQLEALVVVNRRLEHLRKHLKEKDTPKRPITVLTTNAAGCNNKWLYNKFIDNEAVNMDIFYGNEGDEVNNIVRFKGESGPKFYPDTWIDWRHITRGNPGITYDKSAAKFKALIHFNNPYTGKDTCKSAVRGTLEEAIIARNEIAHTLLKAGLITFDKYVRLTQVTSFE